MNKKNLPDNIHIKLKFAAVFLVFFISMISIGHAAKKAVFDIVDPEKIDALNEKAMDFLTADTDKLLQQADQFYKEKKYYEAAQCYLARLKFNLDDSITIYNLACCYARLGKTDLAVKGLFIAVLAGFRDFSLLKNDPDLSPIRNAHGYMKLLDRVPVWADNCGETIYVKTSKVSELRVNLPHDYDPSQKYPLLIGMHGNGGFAEKMMTIMRQALRKKAVILAAPQGAYPNFPQLRGSHFSWEIQTQNRELWKIGDPLAVENLHEVIRVLKDKYPVSEVYILGFSQGAAYALLSGFKYPEMVAGIISIGGVFPETDTEFSILKEKEIENGKKFRIFVAQGNHDPMIPVGTGVKTTKKLKKYGYEVEYQEYEGGHEVSPELLNKIYFWMTKK